MQKIPKTEKKNAYRWMMQLYFSCNAVTAALSKDGTQLMWPSLYFQQSSSILTVKVQPSRSKT